MAKLCCECGVCDLFACPHDLSPRFVSHYLKSRIDPARDVPSLPALEANAFRKAQQLPTARLIQRLEIKAWDVPAPWRAEPYRANRVSLPLRQHLGAPAEPVVNIGDGVERGDLVAAPPEGALGANVHASITGTVTHIDKAITIECV